MTIESRDQPQSEQPDTGTSATGCPKCPESWIWDFLRGRLPNWAEMYTGGPHEAAECIVALSKIEIYIAELEQQVARLQRMVSESNAACVQWGKQIPALEAERDRLTRENTIEGWETNKQLRAESARLTQELADRDTTIKSVSTMLGWGNVPPLRSLELTIKSWREELNQFEKSLENVTRENALLYGMLLESSVRAPKLDKDWSLWTPETIAAELKRRREDG